MLSLQKINKILMQGLFIEYVYILLLIFVFIYHKFQVILIIY